MMDCGYKFFFFERGWLNGDFVGLSERDPGACGSEFGRCDT